MQSYTFFLFSARLTDSANNAGLSHEMGRLLDVQLAEMLEVRRRRRMVDLLHLSVIIGY